MRTAGPAWQQNVSERTFTAQVIQMARLFGWRTAHFRPAMTKRGRWVTAMAGDVGFPDLVLAREGKILFVELKTQKGKLTLDQQQWLEQVNGIVWRPAMIDEIEGILRDGSR